MNPKRLPIYLALDGMEISQCLQLCGKIGDRITGVKANSLWRKQGASIASLLMHAGANEVFADLKLHDIPNTVANDTKDVAEAGAGVLTVHASGGLEMMQAAVKASPGLRILAVTVLTSLDALAVGKIYAGPLFGVALRLARLALTAGVWGLVCSPEDLLFLRMSSHFDPDGLQFVTPGVRLPQGNTHDQKRVRTPFEAIRDGADYLVAGREVTTSSQPLEVLKRYEEEIERGLEERALAERIISGTT